MEEFNLDHSYQYKLKSMPRGKTVIPYTCNAPFYSGTIDLNSNCLLCICDGWLPIPVGKVRDFETLEDMWASPIAKKIQADVSDKKYTWCAVEHCGITLANRTLPKYFLSVNIDESCNLACPSCRRDMIMHTDGPVVEDKKLDVERIVSWLEQFDKPIHIVMTGNGDPFASHVIRNLLKNYRPKVNQTFGIATNGLLIKKQLPNYLIKDSITEFGISIDAGTADTYSIVRKGGSWSVLLENFDYLDSLNKNHMVTLRFCLQQKNYREIEEFLEICTKYKFKPNVHQLDDWATWSPPGSNDTFAIKNGSFFSNNVLDTSHPEHVQCRYIVADILTRYKPTVFSNNVLIPLGLKN